MPLCDVTKGRQAKRRKRWIFLHFWGVHCQARDTYIILLLVEIIVNWGIFIYGTPIHYHNNLNDRNFDAVLAYRHKSLAVIVAYVPTGHRGIFQGYLYISNPLNFNIYVSCNKRDEPHNNSYSLATPNTLEGNCSRDVILTTCCFLGVFLAT